MSAASAAGLPVVMALLMVWVLVLPKAQYELVIESRPRPSSSSPVVS